MQGTLKMAPAPRPPTSLLLEGRGGSLQGGLTAPLGSVALELQQASETPGGLLNTQPLGPHPQSLCYRRSGVGPEDSHFSPISQSCWCCWSGDHTPRTATAVVLQRNSRLRVLSRHHPSSQTPPCRGEDFPAERLGSSGTTC